MDTRLRYLQQHKIFFKEAYPNAWKDGNYALPKFPKTGTANGLTTFVVNFINWSGYNATRISSSGRPIVNGNRVTWIPGRTRRGTADITATIRGRSVKLEIKVGSDKPSQDQIDEQARERKAGGIYEFIKTPEDFFTLFDSI